MINLIKKFIDIIYPSTCICCRKIISQDGLFCLDCFLKLTFISQIKCQICSMPIHHEIRFNDRQICLTCLQKKPAFDFGNAIFIYNETIGKAIIDFKYNDQIFLAKKFSKLFKNQLSDVIKDVDFIACVPLHPKKLIQRKYNQANLIARNICPKKYFPQLLLRIKNDNSQVNLSRNQRIKNLKNTFIVNPKYADKIIGKKILLIDDVMTTLTTLNYCAKALKKRKASVIYVAVIAKTIIDNL